MSAAEAKEIEISVKTKVIKNNTKKLLLFDGSMNLVSKEN